jgi:hypothetical protein
MIAYDRPECFNLAVWRRERDGEPYSYDSGVSHDQEKEEQHQDR